MLFKTIDDISAVFPVIGTTDFNNIKPFIETAERDYIIKLISIEQYEDLDADYNEATPNLSSEQEALLNRIQKALAPYAFYLWVPSGQLSIGDNGIRIASTETHKTAFQWQVVNLQNSLLKQAGSAMDDLLAFMEENKADYDLWAESEAYTLFKETFITSAQQFTTAFSALGNSRTNFLAIKSSMILIEDLVIKTELGDDYFEELKEQHKDGSLSDENKIIYNYIVKAIAHLTINRAITDLSVLIDDRGVLNFNSQANSNNFDNRQPAKDTMITKMEFNTERDGRVYLSKAKQHLINNLSNYPTYRDSTAYTSTTNQTAVKNTEDSKNFGMM
jgi:hypothetical protein